MRQSGRPASHAYGAFHYIKPFQCIIYFCVSHLRYGLCTGDGGQRALCNIADLKIAAWQRLDSARPGIHYPHVRFFTEVLLPSHLYCDKPILHSADRRSPRGRHTLCTRDATRRDAPRRRVLSPEENVCAAPCVRAETRKSPLPPKTRRKRDPLGIHPPVSRTFYMDKLDSRPRSSRGIISPLLTTTSRDIGFA